VFKSLYCFHFSGETLASSTASFYVNQVSSRTSLVVKFYTYLVGCSLLEKSKLFLTRVNYSLRSIADEVRYQKNLSNNITKYALVITVTKKGLSEATSKSLKDLHPIDSTYSRAIDIINSGIHSFKKYIFFTYRELGMFTSTSFFSIVNSRSVFNFHSVQLLKRTCAQIIRNY